RLSERSANAFVTVDCGALPPNLLESELFGHARGAFSGAFSDRIGLFEEAAGGTIFLDEITNTSLDLQAKLLRVLQENEVRRIGENRARAIDVRVIAATNAPIERLVERGEFREDLYYRLNVIHLEVPPLRERVEDIPTLATRFLERARARGSRPPLSISDDALRFLSSLSWRGNIRELENLMEKVAVLADEESAVTAETIRALDGSCARKEESIDSAPPGSPGSSHSLPSIESRGATPISLAEFDRLWLESERRYLLDLVETADWNVSAACRLAQVRNRNTLVSRLKKHGIERPG
ncbi:MAG TPA: sigma 54-interacting transcriptional regulator, partial [Planctomycetota bacterium]|nr:sigma 54-interacting transcriptional regulator [Planctomycetota bacterium]